MEVRNISPLPAPLAPRGLRQKVSLLARMGLCILLVLGISTSPMADIYYIKEKPKNAPKPLTEEERAQQQQGPKRKEHIGPLILKEEPPVQSPPPEATEAAQAISKAHKTHNPAIKGEDALIMANQTLAQEGSAPWKRIFFYLFFVLAGLAVVLGLKWWADKQLPTHPNRKQ